MTNQKYPTVKVILGYALLGGLVNSLSLLLFILFFHITNKNDFNYFWIYLMWSWLVFMPPMLLNSLIIIYLKIHRNYFLSFCIGCFSMLMAILLFLGFLNFSFSMLDINFCLIMIFINGISSAILAKFLLPKS